MEWPEALTALKAQVLPSGKDKEIGTGKHRELIVFHQHAASNTGIAMHGGNREEPGQPASALHFSTYL